MTLLPLRLPGSSRRLGLALAALGSVFLTALTQPGKAVAAEALGPHLVDYSSHGLELKAYVYKPEGAGPFPVYLWNHGSEKNPAPGALVAPLWTEHGVILYVPI